MSSSKMQGVILWNDWMASGNNEYHEQGIVEFALDLSKLIAN
ncbi:MAG: hypothetical protein AAB276_00320 [Pseudomonadota bacterium]